MPSQKRTLASSAYDRLRQDILRGVRRPGERLRLHDLARSYEFGIGALREALSRLVGDGIVLFEDQRGFSVPMVSRGELADLLEMRLFLEERGIRLSIERGGVDWEVGVMTAFHRLARAGERSGADPRLVDEGCERDHAAFHRALVSGCQSPLLLQFRETVHAQGDRYRHLYLQNAIEGRDHLAEHRRITEAALSRNADETVRLVRAHLRQTVDDLLAAGLLPELPGTSPENAAGDGGGAAPTIAGKEKSEIGRKHGSKVARRVRRG